MTFDEYQRTRDLMTRTVDLCAAQLSSFPSGPNGLTPDAVKFSPEYRAAKRAFDENFAILRRVNAYGLKHFAKQLRAEREAVRLSRPTTA